jgi:hypothetical protein
MNQLGGACSLCGAEGVNKTTCPMNAAAKNPKTGKHLQKERKKATVPATRQLTPEALWPGYAKKAKVKAKVPVIPLRERLTPDAYPALWYPGRPITPSPAILAPPSPISPSILTPPSAVRRQVAAPPSPPRRAPRKLPSWLAKS